MQRFLVYGWMIILILSACKNGDHTSVTAIPGKTSLIQSANSEPFNRSFEHILNDYYSLKDALIAGKDTITLNKTALSLLNSADSIQLGDLKADSSIINTANSFADGIVAELKGFMGENRIEDKLKSFQLISDQLYDLARTVQYSQSVIFHFYCPTAFMSQGAYWLNASTEIKNPYDPVKKLSCGELKDSIDYRQKK